MSLTRDDVAKIAHLARLDLTAAQLDQYREQLSAILDYAEMLDELDLDDVAPTAHAIARQNVMRPDKIEPGLSLEDALFNAPQQQASQFKIQPVLDE